MKKLTRIDFETGRIYWEAEGIPYVFPDLGANSNGVKAARFTSLDFEGVEVDIAYRSDQVRSFSIDPPAGYDFKKNEIWAPKLAQALSKICPKEIYPRYGQASFPWGKITIYTEWRDGGWGASFDYIEQLIKNT